MVKIFKTRRNILTDTIETSAETGKDISKETVKSMASIGDINAFLYGPSEKPPEEEEHKKYEKIIEEHGLEKKAKEEREKMKANHTPLDIRALQEKHHTEAIKKRLFNLVKEDEKKAQHQIQEKEERKKHDEHEEEERKKHEIEEKKNAQPAEDAHGKEKGKLGQPRKKASTDPHQNFEQKANRGK